MKNTDSIITELVASLHCKACPFVRIAVSQSRKIHKLDL